MSLQYSPKNNPRVIVIQKLYGKYFNEDENLTFPKHRFKKFIKDVVNGTIERDEVINDEISNHLNLDLDLKKLDKVFQVIIKSAIFEFLFKSFIVKDLSVFCFIINKKLRFFQLNCLRSEARPRSRRSSMPPTQGNELDSCERLLLPSSSSV